MKMNKSFAVTLTLAAIGIVVPYSIDAADAGSSAKGILAYPMVTKAPAASSVSRTGTVKIVITLAIESAIGTDEPISCSASISTSDASFDNSANATGTIVRSGATGTATLTIPYDWTMATSGEQATLSVNCSEGNGYTSGGVSHSIYFAGSAFTVPHTNGTVTTKDLSASM